MESNIFVIEGNGDNNVTFNGRNMVLEGNKSDALIVKSVLRNGRWLVPENIIIKNYIVNGGIRIYGLGLNGQGELVKQSSRNTNHTQYCQSAAPRNITFENLTITANERIPFYVAPGCTNINLRNCKIQGKSVSTAIYLDCESASNIVEHNVFDIQTKRELFAIDGSANNIVNNNVFNNVIKGGIYLYRNSGEGGTIRHQSPSNNKVINNVFNYKRHDFLSKLIRTIAFPTVWVNSRSGILQYFYSWKNDDRGWSFGSSVTDEDLGEGNVIKNNEPKEKLTIRVS